MKWRIAYVSFYFVLLSFTTFGQQLHSHWIDYNQPYLAIKVPVEGVYSISHNQLSAAVASTGDNLSNISSASFALYYLGEEIPLWVKDGGDNSINPADELIFYCHANNARFDSALYETPQVQTNPYIGLFGDSATLYLTWNQSNSAKYNSVSSQNSALFNQLITVDREAIVAFNQSFHRGEITNSKWSPGWNEGEGFMMRPLRIGQSESFNVSISDHLSSNISVSCEVYGRNNLPASGFNHKAQLTHSGSSLIDSKEFNGYQSVNLAGVVSRNAVNNGSLSLSLSSLQPAGNPSDSRLSAPFVRCSFTSFTDTINQLRWPFTVPSRNDTTFIEIKSFPGNQPVLFDPVMLSVTNLHVSGSDFQGKILPGPERQLYLINESAIQPVSSIRAVQNNNSPSGFFTNYLNTTLDSGMIIITTRDLETSAQTYASYKSSVGITARVVLIEDLYEQFGHGMDKNPVAIRHYVHDALTSDPNPPAHLFLIGKAVDYVFTINSSTNRSENKLPSWGFPATDWLITAGLLGLPDHESPITVGRLVARNNSDVLNYLAKVREYELLQSNPSTSIRNAIWKKRYLYSEGAGESNLQRLLLSYYDDYVATLSDTNYGMQGYSFLKRTSSAVDPIANDSLVEFLENGSNLVHFFGHGSASNLGINIGEPEDYRTQGKYPLFIASSCNVGNLHLEYIPTLSLNEKWVLTPDAGAIGFLASTTQGFVAPLHLYNRALFRNMSQTHYGLSIGKQMQFAASDLTTSLGRLLKETIQEVNLHGDPSIVINAPPKPDLAVEAEFFKTEPERLSTELSRFTLVTDIFNLGKAIKDSIEIQLTLTYADGSDTVFTRWITELALSKKLEWNVPIDNQKSIGANTLRIELDPEDQIDEIDNSFNNTAQIEVTVTSNALIPIYPLPYAIIGDKNPILSASTADPRAPSRQYRFQIDTTDQFSSPLLRETTITSSGGVVQWQPSLSYWPDSVVYYWRTTPVLADEEKWLSASFEYIPNRSGWSQSHFFQYEKNRFEGLEFNRPKRTIKSSGSTVTVSAQTKGNPGLNGNAFENSLTTWSLNNEIIGREGFCQNRPSLLVSIINPQSLEVWSTRYDRDGNLIAPNNFFGNYNDPINSNCPRGDYKFMYLVDSSYFESMKNIIQQVPDSFYILIAAANRLDLNKTTPSGQNIWSTTGMYSFLENLGSDSIRFAGSQNPWLFFTQKGNPNKAVEVLADSSRSLIRLNASFSRKIPTGTMTSVIVGPTNNWGSLVWRDTPRAPFLLNDSSYVSVYGIESTGKSVLLGNLNENEITIPQLSQKFSSINQYPYLQLEYGTTSKNESKPNRRIDRWHVTYAALPELAISVKDGYSFHSDSLYQGEELEVTTPVLNVSPVKAPEHLIVYDFSQYQNTDIRTAKIKPGLNGNGNYTDDVKLPTRKKTGPYQFKVWVNPDDTSKHFPEYHRFNNSLTENLFVKRDNVNPLLDVTFDGRHIMDGDIVSSKPTIIVEASDDNAFLPLTDTATFDVFLAGPIVGNADRNYKRLSFQSGDGNGGTLQFEPGNSNKNKARILYEPKFEKDGTYALKVQSRDATGNQSGQEAYEITFEIIQQASITHVLNYPNPFSTATQFVFTITGERVPDMLTIQILTISGKVIRTIHKEELGPLYVGRNITQYRWDGTDEYGDRLANGVYLYKVTSGLLSDKLEHRETSADGYFKKGFGKMYLIR